MADTYTSPSEPGAVEAWSKRFESTMKPYTDQETSAKQTADGKDDPWVNFIDQLWKSNPYSKLLPIDPAESARPFQQTLREALSRPGHHRANDTNFVQLPTQL